MELSTTSFLSSTLFQAKQNFPPSEKDPAYLSQRQAAGLTLTILEDFYVGTIVLNQLLH